MSWILIAAIALVLAAIPSVQFLVNLRRYRPPPRPLDRPVGVSVVIPARDEEQNIGEAVRAALDSRGVDLEVLVVDDHSEDRTAEIALSSGDPRVRVVQPPPLPPGWNGKQHAAAHGASQARHPVLVFVDADVQLAPDALGRMAAFLEHSGAALASGAPREVTGTLLERLIIPLVHFVLLGFLPLGRMRRSTHPAYAAGVGQLFVARREIYQAVGGHGAIRASRHDGLGLPRAFRAAGHPTDLFDATELATCRMYASAGEVWRGFAKNADEGLGRPSLIVPATALLLGGQVLPFLLLALSPWLSWPTTALSAVAVGLALAPRLVSRARFRQAWISTILHPLGVALLVAIQWYALVFRLAGGSISWKGRGEAVEPPAPHSRGRNTVARERASTS